MAVILNASTGVDFSGGVFRGVHLRRQGGRIRVGAVCRRELPSLSDGAAEPSKADLALLRSAVRASGLPLGSVAAGLSGPGVIVRYVQVPPVPPHRLDLIMRFEVEASSTSMDQQSIAYDYRVLNLPLRSQQFTVMLALAKNEAVEGRRASVRSAGAGDPEIDLPTLGAYAGYRLSRGLAPAGFTLLLDVGRDAMNVAIEGGGDLYFVRTVTPGTQVLVHALAEGMSLKPGQAQALFRESGCFLPAPPPSGEGEGAPPAPEAAPPSTPTISGILSRAAEDLVRAVRATIAFCKTQTKLEDFPIEKIFLTGEGAAIKGFAAYLSDRLKAPVEEVNLLGPLDLSGLDDEQRRVLESDRHGFTAALGLALSRLEETGIRFDLRTGAVREKSEFRRRTAWLYAGAAAYAAALLASLFFLLDGRNALRDYAGPGGLQDRKIKQAVDQLKGMQAKESEVKTAKAKLDYLRGEIDFSRKVLELMKFLRENLSKNVQISSLTCGGREGPPPKREPIPRDTVILQGLAKALPGQPHLAAHNEVKQFIARLDGSGLFVRGGIRDKGKNATFADGANAVTFEIWAPLR